MNVYDAIMKAADHIEWHAGAFDFGRVGVPLRSCDSSGCAIGWINFFHGTDLPIPAMFSECGIEGRGLINPMGALGVDDRDFYMRVDGLPGALGWREDSATCASALRLYAAKHHAPKPAQTFDDFKRDLMAKVAGERIPEDAIG